jgi:hypothetical protein
MLKDVIKKNQPLKALKAKQITIKKIKIQIDINKN